MSPTILLVTDRPAFETVWREALGTTGFVLRAVHPNSLASELAPGVLLVLDAGSSTYDEDELLTAVGLAKALGLVTAVALPEAGGFTGIEDLLEDLCPGLVAKSSGDVARIGSILQRRADRGRANRFEYLTVSPRPNELLALLGDGSAALLTRPVSEEDDNSEVAGITLEGDAQAATLRLSSGRELTIRASAVVSVAGQATQGGPQNNHNGLDGAGAVDGARLGARLRELRLAAGLTQAELARRTGIHRPNIARVEAGRHTPSLETLARLATAIGVPTTTVLSAK